MAGRRFLLAGFVILALFGDVIRGAKIFGLADEDAAPYLRTDKQFECFDKSSIIPVAMVNDNYCDCPDASDEPGTSACPNGIFTCENLGHVASKIPSSRVNDGLCDCCDGSDELREGKSDCENTCEAEAKIARREAEKRAAIQKTAWKEKKEKIAEGQMAKSKRAQELSDLKVQIEEMDKKVGELEEMEVKAKEAEEAERLAREARAAKGLDVKNGCAELTNNYDAFMQEIAAFEDELSSLENQKNLGDSISLETLSRRLDLALSALPTAKTLCSRFQEDIDDEHSDEEEEEDDPEDLDKIIVDDDEVAWTDSMYFFVGDVLDGVRSVWDSIFCSLGGECKPGSFPLPKTPLGKIQADLREVTGNLEGVRKRLQEVEKMQDLDFGPEEEYFGFHGQCFSFPTPEYNYEFCPFGKATQRSKNGGNDAHLGNFRGWETVGENRYGGMAFTNGGTCWGAPQRHMLVKFRCGATSGAISVEEPSKCEYVMEFETPLACMVSESSPE